MTHDFARRSLLLAGAGALAAGCAAARAEEASPPELFIFTFRPGPTWQTGMPMNRQALGPHAAYWRQLVADGRAFAAGGFTGSDGGMAIVVAADIEEARAILEVDPAITSGVFVAEIEQWRPRFRTEAPLPGRQ